MGKILTLMNNKHLYSYDTGDETETKFSVIFYEDNEYYHVRTYYRGYPTKKGVVIRTDQFDEFLKGVEFLKGYDDKNRSKATN